jgi:hypothetical protein
LCGFEELAEKGMELCCPLQAPGHRSGFDESFLSALRLVVADRDLVAANDRDCDVMGDTSGGFCFEQALCAVDEHGFGVTLCVTRVDHDLDAFECLSEPLTRREIDSNV